MKRYIFILIYLFTLLPFSVTYAQTTQPVTGEYTVLAPLPGTTKDNCVEGTNCKADINSYLSGFLPLVIGIGAMIAMILLGFYGFQYAMSDSASVKMAYRGKLWEIVQGLLLIISAYAIIYTINPDLLKFELEITTPKSFTATPTATSSSVQNGGGAFSTGRTGCRTDCVYQYTNSSGSLVAYKNCFECNAATTYGLEIKTREIDGKNALINRDLGSRLAAIQTASNQLGTQPQFIVTETWPPTVNHIEQGQYNGTSVDVAFKTTATATQINKFIEIARQNGLRAQYEVTNETARQQLIQQGVSPGDVLSVGHATGGHFSIYKK